MEEKKPQSGIKNCQKYRYKNVSQADLLLPRLSEDKKKSISPGGEFIGDEYYKSMVPQYLHIIQVLDTSPVLTLPPAKEVLEETRAICNKSQIPSSIEVKVEAAEVKVENPPVVVGSVEKKPKIPLTPEILKELRAQGKSWAAIAREIGYSLPYLSKKKKEFTQKGLLL